MTIPLVIKSAWVSTAQDHKQPQWVLLLNLTKKKFPSSVPGEVSVPPWNVSFTHKRQQANCSYCNDSPERNGNCVQAGEKSTWKWHICFQNIDIKASPFSFSFEVWQSFLTHTASQSSQHHLLKFLPLFLTQFSQRLKHKPRDVPSSHPPGSEVPSLSRMWVSALRSPANRDCKYSSGWCSTKHPFPRFGCTWFTEKLAKMQISRMEAAVSVESQMILISVVWETLPQTIRITLGVQSFCIKAYRRKCPKSFPRPWEARLGSWKGGDLSWANQSRGESWNPNNQLSSLHLSSWLELPALPRVCSLGHTQEGPHAGVCSCPGMVAVPGSAITEEGARPCCLRLW